MRLAAVTRVRSLSSAVLVLLATGAVAHADRLVDARQVIRGDYLAPRVSPDGREVLLTGPQLRGLYVAPLGGSASARQLTDADEAGVFAHWLADGTVGFRAPFAGARRDLVVDRTGVVRTVAA